MGEMKPRVGMALGQHPTQLTLALHPSIHPSTICLSVCPSWHHLAGICLKYQQAREKELLKELQIQVVTVGKSDLLQFSIVFVFKDCIY